VALKTLTPEQFKETVTERRMPAGMLSFTQRQSHVHLDNPYNYLKRCSDGTITQPKVEAMK